MFIINSQQFHYSFTVIIFLINFLNVSVSVFRSSSSFLLCASSVPLAVGLLSQVISMSSRFISLGRVLFLVPVRGQNQERQVRVPL